MIKNLENIPEHGSHHSVHPYASLEPYLRSVHTSEGCEHSVQNAGQCLKTGFPGY
jgi:hypothetical protein